MYKLENKHKFENLMGVLVSIVFYGGSIKQMFVYARRQRKINSEKKNRTEIRVSNEPVTMASNRG